MRVIDVLRLGKIDPLDRELLLAHALKLARTKLHSNPDTELSASQVRQYQIAVSRREAGEPLAYITGQKEFYGRAFQVTPAVLIPRPATEGLIDLALSALKTKQDQVKTIDSGIIALSHFFKTDEVRTLVDIGTGSGCIGITLALEQQLPVIATDISRTAIAVAKENAAQLNAKIQFINGDLLAPLKNFKQPFFVISNPPYIPEGTQLGKEVEDFEPHRALFAGKHGLNVIHELIVECQAHPACVGIALECEADQEERVRSFFA